MLELVVVRSGSNIDEEMRLTFGSARQAHFIFAIGHLAMDWIISYCCTQTQQPR